MVGAGHPASLELASIAAIVAAAASIVTVTYVRAIRRNLDASASEESDPRGSAWWELARDLEEIDNCVGVLGGWQRAAARSDALIERALAALERANRPVRGDQVTRARRARCDCERKIALEDCWPRSGLKNAAIYGDWRDHRHDGQRLAG